MTYCHSKDEAKCRKCAFHFKSATKYIQLTQYFYNSHCFVALLVFFVPHFWGHFRIFKYLLGDNLQQIAGLHILVTDIQVYCTILCISYFLYIQCKMFGINFAWYTPYILSNAQCTETFQALLKHFILFETHCRLTNRLPDGPTLSGIELLLQRKDN